MAICFLSSHKSLSSCKTKASFALMSYSLCNNETASVYLYLDDNVLRGESGKVAGLVFLWFFLVYIEVQELCVDYFCEQIGGTYGKGTLLKRQVPATNTTVILLVKYKYCCLHLHVKHKDPWCKLR